MIEGGTMKEPGFLRCAVTSTVEGKEYRSVGTVAYAPEADVYQVSLQNVGSDPKGASRFYGILAVPTAEGKFPALMNPPGAGARPYRGLVDLAGKGFITLQVGIHGIPVDLPNEVYDVVTAPKQLLLALETGHFTVPEQTERVDRWIEGQVGRR